MRVHQSCPKPHDLGDFDRPNGISSKDVGILKMINNLTEIINWNIPKNKARSKTTKMHIRTLQNGIHCIGDVDEPYDLNIMFLDSDGNIICAWALHSFIFVHAMQKLDKLNSAEDNQQLSSIRLSGVYPMSIRLRRLMSDDGTHETDMKRIVSSVLWIIHYCCGLVEDGEELSKALRILQKHGCNDLIENLIRTVAKELKQLNFLQSPGSTSRFKFVVEKGREERDIMNSIDFECKDSHQCKMERNTGFDKSRSKRCFEKKASKTPVNMKHHMEDKEYDALHYRIRCMSLISLLECKIRENVELRKEVLRRKKPIVRPSREKVHKDTAEPAKKKAQQLRSEKRQKKASDSCRCQHDSCQLVLCLINILQLNLAVLIMET